MSKVSAGLLMYRTRRSAAAPIEMFLVHPGGPYFARKDRGVWTIPKGEPATDEPLKVAALREFTEETGLSGPDDATGLLELGSIRQKGGKVVHCWAFEGHWDPAAGISSNTFDLEWPPRSGRIQTFPEVDRAAWFTPEAALTYILEAQGELLLRLVKALGAG